MAHDSGRRGGGALETLATLWKRENRPGRRYGAEAPLEQAFIQPVLEAIGWKLIYQTHLEGRQTGRVRVRRRCDAKDAALARGRTNLEFWSSQSSWRTPRRGTFR